ncbi:MOB kinase activator 2 isoform 1-T1 [Alca torda]
MQSLPRERSRYSHFSPGVQRSPVTDGAVLQGAAVCLPMSCNITILAKSTLSCLLLSCQKKWQRILLLMAVLALDSAVSVESPGPCASSLLPRRLQTCSGPGSSQPFSEACCEALPGAQGPEGCVTRPLPLAAAFSGLGGPVRGQSRAGRAGEPRLPPAPSAAAHWRRRAGAGPGRAGALGGAGARRPGRAAESPGPAAAAGVPPLRWARLRRAPPRRTMVGDHCSLPGERPVLAQSPKPGLSCKMVLQAVGKVLRKSKGKPNGKKPAPEEKKLYLEPEYTKSRITDFEFKELVMLPREIDLNEWLASNTTTFFHHINLQYSTISEFCTGESCQTMAVCNTQYYWYDERGKKIKCTAPQYVDFVMSSVQKLVTDEDVFPTKYGKEFPNSFESLVKKICKYLFHVLAHIYSSHFKETLALELHGHLNTLYTHFILFIREFNLVDPKETTIMDDLTEVLCSSSGSSSNGSGNGSSNSAGAQNHVKER